MHPIEEQARMENEEQLAAACWSVQRLRVIDLAALRVAALRVYRIEGILHLNAEKRSDNFGPIFTDSQSYLVNRSYYLKYLQVRILQNERTLERFRHLTARLSYRTRHLLRLQ